MASQSLAIAFPTVAIFIPCICIGSCYFKIFLYVREKKNAMASHDKKDGKKEISNKSIKIAKSLFASFALFTVCWMPYGIVIATDFRDRYPIIVHAWTTFMAHVNSTLNPVFYMLLNPAFRIGFKKLNAKITNATNNNSSSNKLNTLTAKSNTRDESSLQLNK